MTKLSLYKIPAELVNELVNGCSFAVFSSCRGLDNASFTCRFSMVFEQL